MDAKQHSLLFWWTGEDYIALKIVGNDCRGHSDGKGDLLHFPADIAEQYKQLFPNDGFRVVEDKESRHFAALGDPHRSWTVKNLAWLVGKLLPEDGTVPLFGTGLGVEVVHIRDVYRADPPVPYIYIGREFHRGGYHLSRSEWHNPYRLGADGDRTMVLRRYERYLQGLYEAAPDEMNAKLDALRGQTLACFCAPEHCHGDILARVAEMSHEQRIQWAQEKK